MVRRAVVLMVSSAVAAFMLFAASPAGALTKPTTIQLRSILTAPPLVTPDADGNGLPATGDRTFLSSRLVNAKRQLGRARGAGVGRGFVIAWTLAPGLDIGLTALRLRRGVIMFSGIGNLAGPTTATMIGGTGIYENARGTVRARPVSPTEYRVVVRLKPTR